MLRRPLSLPSLPPIPGPRATGTDAVRRGIPLTPDSFHTVLRHRRQASPPAAPAAKPSPGLVGSLGLAGALAPLGLGGLLPGVESAVGGIPIVGAPVAGVLTGADNAVGVTALLSPKDDPAAPNTTVSASTTANVKRQQGDGLIGTLGLDGALGALGLGGLIGTVEQTVDGLPIVGPLVGGLLGSVDGAVGLTALLSPSGTGASASASAATKRDVSPESAGTEPTVPLSTLLSLNSQIQQAAAAQAASNPAFTTVDTASHTLPLGQAHGAAATLQKSATGAVSSSALGGMSIAQAEALGLLPPGFANALLASLKQMATTSADAAGVKQGNPLLGQGKRKLAEGQEEVEGEEASPAATETATSTMDTADPSAASSVVVQARAKAAMAASDASSTVANADYDSEDGDDDPANDGSSAENSSDDSDDDELTFTAATTTATASVTAQPTDGAAVAARDLDDDAESSPPSATYTAMSSSTMAPTPSQAQATASAMSLEPSEEGDTAAPTSTAALRMRSLD